MKGDEPAAPEDPLVSSLTAYHEIRAKGSTEIRAGVTPAESDPEFAELLLRAQACVRLLERRWSGPNRTGDKGEIVSPLLSASSGVLSPGDSAPARIGRFQILRELGRGAFGIVFLALDPALGREVALKVARPETTVTPQFHRRFLTEAQAAAALNHPNVVSVFESGEWGPICYIAQEYCAGPTLAVWLEQRSEPVPVAAAATLVATLAAALDYAHQHGIIHRDLKPSNVMLVPKKGGESVPPDREDDGLDFVPKIADFGLAKLLEKSAAETRSGMILGTPGYMAPEQVEGRLGAIGPQTDIHALGVILYEMLTGRPPFSGATDVEMLKRVALDEPARPHAKRASIPRDLEAICLKCLEKQPARRYPTAAALAEDLARFLAARPTLARPLGSFGRAVNWARRRPAAAALLAISVMAGPAGLAAWWQHTSFRKAVAAEQMRQGFQEERRLILQHKAIARDREQHPGRYAYVADVKAAFEAWKNKHTIETIERLARDVPKAGDEDLRSFAWYYLWRLSHAEPRTIRGHTISGLASPPEFLAFSADGNQIAGLSPHENGNKGSFGVWDTATGSGHSRSQLDGSVGGVASSDGRRLVARATDQLATITVRMVSWERDRWQSVPYTLHPLSSERPVALVCMVVSPDGRTLATGHAHERVSLWALDTGRRIATMIPDGGSDVSVLQFSPDGKTVASGATNGALRLWDVATGKEKAAVPGDGHSINGISFSPDGSRLAAASTGRTVKLWNTVTDTEPAILQGHANEVRTVAFSPDGKTLASGSKDGTVRLWDVATWQELISLDAQRGGVHVIDFSPDGNMLASGGTAADGRGEIFLWSTATGARSLVESKKPAATATQR
jgi:eukaryotic-like serine/threonine-protein kinase